MKIEDPGRKATFPIDEAFPTEVPPGVDRRTFMMRSAVISSAAVITGCTPTEKRQTAAASAPPPVVKGNVSPDLDVVKKSKGPVMTTLEEFYKVGPGPSSSHTIGPMRITHDFYQRCTKLPREKLDQATALKVHLFGSLSATGKGHDTERASLAGIVGKELSEDESYRARGYVWHEGEWIPRAEHEAILRARDVEAERDRERREAESRVREAEARAKEAEARAQEAEAQQASDGIPLWYAWGAGPAYWPVGPIVAPPGRPVARPRPVPR